MAPVRLIALEVGGDHLAVGSARISWRELTEEPARDVIDHGDEHWLLNASSLEPIMNRGVHLHEFLAYCTALTPGSVTELCPGN